MNVDLRPRKVKWERAINWNWKAFQHSIESIPIKRSHLKNRKSIDRTKTATNNNISINYLPTVWIGQLFVLHNVSFLCVHCALCKLLWMISFEDNNRSDSIMICCCLQMNSIHVNFCERCGALSISVCFDFFHVHEMHHDLNMRDINRSQCDFHIDENSDHQNGQIQSVYPLSIINMHNNLVTFKEEKKQQ